MSFRRVDHDHEWGPDVNYRAYLRTLVGMDPEWWYCVQLRDAVDVDLQWRSTHTQLLYQLFVHLFQVLSTENTSIQDLYWPTNTVHDLFVHLLERSPLRMKRTETPLTLMYEQRHLQIGVQPVQYFSQLHDKIVERRPLSWGENRIPARSRSHNPATTHYRTHYRTAHGQIFFSASST